jgi:OmpA-OmpF porin, OOP family
MNRMRWIGCLVGALMSVCGTAGAQDRTRIDLGDEKIDQRSIIDQLDKAISVVPGTPSGGGVAPAPISLMMRVEFAFASAGLTPNAAGTLDRVAAILNDPKLQQRRFLVEGHTDAVGSDAKNVQLSQQRAMSVMAYLQQRGIRADRLSATGFGKAQLLPGVGPTDGRNRRVEIVPLQ